MTKEELEKQLKRTEAELKETAQRNHSLRLKLNISQKIAKIAIDSLDAEPFFEPGELIPLTDKRHPLRKEQK